MAKITYNDKIGITPKTVHINQVWDDDMNEIKNVVNALDDTVNSINTGGASPIVVSAIWAVGFSFNCTAYSFPIGNEFYTANPTLVTLSDSDATLDRIDLIVAKIPTAPSSVGTIQVIEGDLATSELVVPPDYDPSVFYVIKQVIVRANSALPTDGNGNTVSKEVVYSDGNGEPNEWTFTSNNATIVNSGGFIDATNPTYKHRATMVNNVTVGELNSDGYFSLSFDLTLKEVLGDSYVGIKFSNELSQQLTSILYIKDGDFGIDGNSLTSQTIIIDSGSFNFLVAGNIYEVQIFVNKTFLGYKLDNISLNIGSSIDIPKPFTVPTNSVGVVELKDEVTDNILWKDNTEVYAPTTDYHPATKKYVDDNAGGIEEAPIDGKQYARKDAAWEVVSGGGGTEYGTRVDMGASFEIDWANPNEVFLKTIDSATPFTDINLPTGVNIKNIRMYLTGTSPFTPPSYWVLRSSTYDVNKINRIEADCINGDSGSELVYYTVDNVEDTINPSVSLKFTIDTSLGSGDTFEIPINGSGYNYNVSTDDGYIAVNITGSHVITFPTGAGVHQIEITGDFPRIYFRSKTDLLKLKSIDQWGIGWGTSFQDAFYGCSNLTYVDPNLDTSSVTNTNGMFVNCPLFNSDLSGWDMSSVTNIGLMFFGCSSFNSDISGWDVSNVTSFLATFRGCSNFNSNVVNWDVSNANDFSSMFFGCSSFTSDISGWNTVKATSMGSMFNNASSFNRDLSGWCVSLIASLPTDFATGATAWVLPKPIWGTCP